MSDFDPIGYGELRQRVASLESRIDKQSRQLDELLALANRGRGAFWFAGLTAGAVGAMASALWHWLVR